METPKRIRVIVRQLIRSFAVVSLLLVGSFATARAQTVEEKLSALESRIQQLEQELAEAKGSSELAAGQVQQIGAQQAVPFVRPAVLVTSPGSLEAAAAARPAAMAPPPQAPPTDFSGDFEGLNFFKGVKFGGFLDAYYSWNFNEPSSGLVTYRNFDIHHNSLTLSQADFEITKAVSEESPLGYNLQMVFGPTANLVNGGDFGIGNSTAAHFLQYYLSGRVPVGRGLTLDVGKFVTQHGAEVIDTRADWNYSRGLLFAWAIPYYHFGLRATYPVSDKVTLAAYLVNGWNNVVDNNAGKTGGFQLVLNPTSRVSFIQNYMVGPEQTGNSDDIRHLFDSVLTVKLHDKITFMANYDYGMDRNAGARVHWQGAAGYLKFQVTPTFALIPRFEYFDDRRGFMTGAAQQMKEFTITPEFTINNNLVMRFEYRHDWSNRPNFEVSDPSDDPTRQDTAALGLILKF